ncbi:hypothetical protein E4T39_05759 [Aureobasidium subglaciale]|nr:hypothetical protein E4T39_05759 [Aureobasidium subglaciale]
MIVHVVKALGCGALYPPHSGERTNANSLRKRLLTGSHQLSASETSQTERHVELDTSFHLEAADTTRHRVPCTISPTQSLGSLSLATPSHATYAPLNIQALTTTLRTLDGVTVSASAISNIFELYFAITHSLY